MLPQEHLWPIDEFWDYHAGGGGYSNVKVFTAALENRYGKAKGLRGLSSRKSQAMTYEANALCLKPSGQQ